MSRFPLGSERGSFPRKAGWGLRSRVGSVAAFLLVGLSFLLFASPRLGDYDAVVTLKIPSFSIDRDTEEEVAIVTRLDRLTDRPKVAFDASPPSAISLPSLDRRVVERTPMGMLPRAGPSGETPMEVYARPFSSAFRRVPFASDDRHCGWRFGDR